MLLVDRWSREQFITFFENGETDAMVGERLGVSKSSVVKIRNHHNIPPNKKGHYGRKSRKPTPDERETLKAFIAAMVFAQKREKEFNVLDCVGVVRDGVIKPSDVRVI